ncbi:MAG: hypothetical protein OEW12_03540 [Deltaproteobacteria bacterium]|nr:hypothetical protein [Deltaproteobacteria bacterium]
MSDITTKNPAQMTPQELEHLLFHYVGELMKLYDAGQNRIVTPENVYQPGVAKGRDLFEELQEKLFLPNSGVEGLEHLDQCLEDLKAGRQVIFLADHRGNFDVPSFNALLRRHGARYAPIQDRLTYVAGRKLNESSDLVKMFTEKYSRLVIVPRREIPQPSPDETPAQTEARLAVEADASRINRAAFRALMKLKKEGHIFVLFPLGGRYKSGAKNEPVKESTSYVRAFDTAYLISMEGNLLPTKEVMEEERPVAAKVVFRVGPPLDCKRFLEQQQAAFEALKDTSLADGSRLPPGMDADQYAVNHIMEMLANLRRKGGYDMENLSPSSRFDTSILG